MTSRKVAPGTLPRVPQQQAKGGDHIPYLYFFRNKPVSVSLDTPAILPTSPEPGAKTSRDIGAAERAVRAVEIGRYGIPKQDSMETTWKPQRTPE